MTIRSPWIEQLDSDPPARPLASDVRTDIGIIGAGIAGVATAFFTLRSTNRKVMLLEQGRAGRGATGHNAGQLTSYFERPLRDLVATYGFEPAIDAQRGFDGAHDLLDLLVAETGARGRIERFTGHMGMFTLNHLEVHLENMALRRRGGLRMPSCIVSEKADFLDRIPAHYSPLYSIVPQAEILARLGTNDTRYRAVLSDVAGCANSALLVQETLNYLLRVYPDRFGYADQTEVTRIELTDKGALIRAGKHRVDTDRVVLCTNGYTHHAVVDRRGGQERPITSCIQGIVGYMTGYLEPRFREPFATSMIRNTVIGGSVPYAYLTRRTWDIGESPTTLTCVGGAEEPAALAESPYQVSRPFPDTILEEIKAEILPLVAPDRSPMSELDYAWHGVMGYSGSGVRLIGPEPTNASLLYNLGCNGVGFLLSIYGGERIARHLAGSPPTPNIFDPI